MRQWQKEGVQIVLLMDCNVDVLGVEMQGWINSLELIESMTARYALGQEVSMYKIGQNKIDGTFISQSIEINQGGYLPF